MNLARFKKYDDTILTPEDERDIEEARNEPDGTPLEVLIAEFRLEYLLSKQKKSYAKV